MRNKVSISIVSHGHGPMLNTLCRNLLNLSSVSKIILTLNIPENLKLPATERLIIVTNRFPKGFGANHNEAFRLCDSEYFAVINPDISFEADVFHKLIICLKQTNSALVAPLVLSPSGPIEDSARHFPTPFNLVKKFFLNDLGDYRVAPGGEFFYPDWVAGMFMLFKANSFAAVGGFDEAFHLYYEDVDIGVRLWKKGFRIVVCPSVSIVHDAQRTSRKNPRYMLWHIKSMLLFFSKHWGRLPRTGKSM